MELSDFRKAQKVLKQVVRETKLIKTNITDFNNVYVKPENNQVTGSFKVRGAFYKISSLTPLDREKGVIACSAGNHAQGVALACQKLGIKAHICMPKSTASVKINNTKQYGADVILVEGTYDDAYTKACELQKKYGYTFVHPFNDELVITGQGTLALEILEELPNTDMILCPIGGGGLISGVAAAAKMINPNIIIVGVEPIGAPGMFASFASHKRTNLNMVSTMAEGAAVKSVGELNFKYVEKYVDDIIAVSEEDIINAIKYYYNNYHLICEGAGALSLAAALKYDYIKNSPSNIVCIISGGNIDEDILDKCLKS